MRSIWSKAIFVSCTFLFTEKQFFFLNWKLTCDKLDLGRYTDFLQVLRGKNKRAQLKKRKNELEEVTNGYFSRSVLTRLAAKKRVIV